MCGQMPCWPHSTMSYRSAQRSGETASTFSAWGDALTWWFTGNPWVPYGWRNPAMPVRVYKRQHAARSWGCNYQPIANSAISNRKPTTTSETVLTQGSKTSRLLESIWPWNKVFCLTVKVFSLAVLYACLFFCYFFVSDLNAQICFWSQAFWLIRSSFI